MPTYQFKCQETGEVLDYQLSLEEIELIGEGWSGALETGEKRTWRRVYTPPAIKFLGSGFYSNGG